MQTRPVESGVQFPGGTWGIPQARPLEGSDSACERWKETCGSHGSVLVRSAERPVAFALAADLEGAQ